MSGFIHSPINSQRLHGRLVFLSASRPVLERGAAYFEGVDPLLIANAAQKAAETLFGASGGILFGGHPTITPLVLSVVRDYVRKTSTGDSRRVQLFQSELFRGSEPEEVRTLLEEGFAEVHWIKATGDRKESLTAMRREMLKAGPVACILIGGMEGVYAPGSDLSEFEMFRTMWKGRPVYPIAAAGGASRILWEAMRDGKEEVSWEYRVISPEDLVRPEFSFLMSRIVDDIIVHLE